MVTDIFRNNIHSYKDLPKNLYHIQWKFRDEIRPRFGVMRGREFLMKDAYTFDIDQISAVKTYNQMYLAYMQTFRDMGLTVIPVLADNGPIGGNLSHEFHILADNGESTIFYDKKFLSLTDQESLDIEKLQTLYAAAEEKHDPDKCPLSEHDLASSKGIEVGHIFYIGTKYAKAMNALVNSNNGNLVPVEMSSYGIGISRLLAAIIESSHDDKGIIWPTNIAPFLVSLINLNINDNYCNSLSRSIYDKLTANNIEVLYDDTSERAGSKFATHDLIGSPYQIIIGPKKAVNNVAELKSRKTGKIEDLFIDAICDKIIYSNDLKNWI
jgi:prolyl-tRNA synthetase